MHLLCSREAGNGTLVEAAYMSCSARQLQHFWDALDRRRLSGLRASGLKSAHLPIWNVAAPQKLPGAPAGSGLRHGCCGRRHESSSRLGAAPSPRLPRRRAPRGPCAAWQSCSSWWRSARQPSFAHYCDTLLVAHAGTFAGTAGCKSLSLTSGLFACRAQACRCGLRTQHPSRARACSWRSTCRRVVANTYTAGKTELP